MSAQELVCQGVANIKTAIAQGSGEFFSLSATLPNGPPPGQVWVLDAATFMLTDPVALDGSFVGPSGIFVVPISAPLPENVDTAASISAAARGLNIVPTIGNSAGNPGELLPNTWGTGTFAGIEVDSDALSNPIVIVPGFTLRAIWWTPGGLAIAVTTTLYLWAAIRTLQAQ